jgi:hypothetical protein
MTQHLSMGGAHDQHSTESLSSQPFEEQHFPIGFWARSWGFSAKTVREWFRDEYGSGILRQQKSGRRKKREYTTITVSATGAARVYAKRTGGRGLSGTREVM